MTVVNEDMLADLGTWFGFKLFQEPKRGDMYIKGTQWLRWNDRTWVKVSGKDIPDNLVEYGR